jgi:glycosyltransferase involved in cell wall biosynthesis
MNVQTSVPDISVILPAYNSAAMIGEAVDSVLSQTGVSLELIVVDDGSTDATADVVAHYADTRVRFIRQENKGPGAARNTGITHARADHIAFLDSDDIFLPGSLKPRLAIFQRYPDVDFVFADAYVELKEGDIARVPFYRGRAMLSKFKDCIEKRDGNVYFLNKNQRDCCMRDNLFPWTGTVLVRKSCLVSLGLFDEHLRGSEDKLMWIKLMKSYRVAFLDMPCAVYKKYRSGLTRDFERYCVDSITNARMFLETECSGKSRGHTRVMRHKISDHYFELGYHHFHQGSLAEARSSFLGAVRFNAGDAKSYLYLAATFVPQRLVRKLRVSRGSDGKP